MPVNDIDGLLSKLRGVKKISTGYMAMCPAHKDTHRSLSIKADIDNVAVLYCHAGCQYKNILNILGLKESNLPIFQSAIDKTYDYTDENGNLLYQVVRYHPKNFKHRRPHQSEWIWNLNGIEPVLYQLPLVIKAVEEGKLIWLVEGEKDVASLMAQEIIATTASGGASAKWLPQYTRTLHGANIAIIPDNDEAGQARVLRVAKRLYGWARGIKIVYLPKDTKDVTDWFEKGHTKAELLEQYNSTRHFTIKGEITIDDLLDMLFDIKGHLIYNTMKLKSFMDKKKGGKHQDVI